MVSYLLFLVALVGLPLAALTRWRAQQHHSRAHHGARLIALSIAVPAAMAWDRQAAQWGMWRWSTPLTLGWRWWGLPVEEIAFIVLLVLLVLALCDVLRVMPPQTIPWRRAADGLLACLLAIGVGSVMRAVQLARLPGHAHPMYLTYLMLGVVPVLALHWLVGWRALWRARHVLLGVVACVAIWYTLADALALRVGIWSFATADLTGQRWGNVPSEETLFFGAVALLVAQTYVILLAPGWSAVAAMVWGRVRRVALLARPRAQATRLSGGPALVRRRSI